MSAPFCDVTTICFVKFINFIRRLRSIVEAVIDAVMNKAWMPERAIKYAGIQRDYLA